MASTRGASRPAPGEGLALEAVACLTAARARGQIESVDDLARAASIPATSSAWPRPVRSPARWPPQAGLLGRGWYRARHAPRYGACEGGASRFSPSPKARTWSPTTPAWDSALAATRSRCCATACARKDCHRRRTRPLAARPLARAAGLVLNRQRPGTASGVTFMTLEDETGHVNVVRLARPGRAAAARAPGCAPAGGVRGRWSARARSRISSPGICGILTPLLGDLMTHSRDFH